MIRPNFFGIAVVQLFINASVDVLHEMFIRPCVVVVRSEATGAVR